MIINVVLDSGDHFLFSCHNDLYADYFYDLDSSFPFTDLCAEVPTLKQVNPPTDNISFVFTGSSAEIHVLDPYYHFNITRSMSFEGITFRGESALAQPIDSSAVPSYPPLATIPTTKCTITEIDRCTALDGYTCGSTLAAATAATYGSHK